MAEQTVLSKDALFSEEARKLDIEAIDIPELGGIVYVKAMSGMQRDQFESWALSDKGPRNIRGKAAAMCIVDAQGKRMYQNSDAARLGDTRVARSVRGV